MKESTATQLSPEARDYLQAWEASATQVLSQVAGAPLAVACLSPAPPDAPPAAATDLCLLAICSGSLRGEMSLRLPQPVALRLAQLFMGEAQEAGAEFKTEHREAVEELFRQIAGHAATALKPKYGEAQLRLEAGPPSWPAAAVAWLGTAPDAACKLLLEVQFSAALLAALCPLPESLPQSAAARPDLPGKLELVMDVELAATLRFGSRRMLLRDILELNAGTVVELDRQIQDPVDLLLDDRLIARGEVVVVDGNYGLRVTELVSSEPVA